LELAFVVVVIIVGLEAAIPIYDIGINPSLAREAMQCASCPVDMELVVPIAAATAKHCKGSPKTKKNNDGHKKRKASMG